MSTINESDSDLVWKRDADNYLNPGWPWKFIAADRIKTLSSIADEIAVTNEAALQRCENLSVYKGRIDHGGMNRLQSRAWLLDCNFDHFAQALNTGDMYGGDEPLLSRELVDKIWEEIQLTGDNLHGVIDCHEGPVMWYCDERVVKTFSDMVAAYSMMWTFFHQLLGCKTKEDQVRKLQGRNGRAIIAKAHSAAEKANKEVAEIKRTLAEMKKNFEESKKNKEEEGK
ncbi:hypothetical protein QBC43DRAFT_325789 [Cladorrhinum sp. PSN259]|nr:hypothetical protein QBC43DRAFT_325789 [Cladorrhinum sp. PSN259]